MKYIKCSRGFTLIEMLIVLLIISVLMIIAIPNVSKHFSTVDEKGCSAYLKMVESQVEAYRLDKNVYPKTAEELFNAGFLKDQTLACPNGKEVVIGADGKVSLAGG